MWNRRRDNDILDFALLWKPLGGPAPRVLVKVQLDLYQCSGERRGVEQHPPTWFGTIDQRCSFGQATQESGGDGVELADVPEGERPQA
ncbi:hypothetical protein M2275_008181 [Rhodococcus opacus]|nr:hypothetical protein [Rhodococcus opacus]